jgi:4'-phosphopantetheinyl transferase EntD
MISTAPVLATILPANVQSEECFGHRADATLMPEEAATVAHAVAHRRREHASVRACARVCLERLGHPPAAIPTGPGGAPVWPRGIRGSMTHCRGYVAAAAGTADQLCAIGIDAEPDAPLPDGVLGLVSTPAERVHLAGLPQTTHPGPHWDRLLFSAKESVFKAWFSMVGLWLDPLDTVIVIDARDHTFSARLRDPGLVVDGVRVTRVSGRWTRGHDLLVTGVVLNAAGRRVTASR